MHPSVVAAASRAFDSVSSDLDFLRPEVADMAREWFTRGYIDAFNRGDLHD
jgi:hypothetical protein